MQKHPKQTWFALIFSIFVIAGVTYFSFAAVQGEYGTFRRVEVEAQEVKLKRELAELRAERAEVANRVKRLQASYLDLDLLDEQARKVLGLARGDEIVIR